MDHVRVTLFHVRGSSGPNKSELGEAKTTYTNVSPTVREGFAVRCRLTQASQGSLVDGTKLRSLPVERVRAHLSHERRGRKSELVR